MEDKRKSTLLEFVEEGEAIFEEVSPNQVDGVIFFGEAGEVGENHCRAICSKLVQYLFQPTETRL